MKPSTLTGQLLDAKQLAEQLVASLSAVRRWDANGTIPRPVKIGSRVRWNRSEIEAWISAGCPSRQKWEAGR